jgi:hypothetical protein
MPRSRRSVAILLAVSLLPLVGVGVLDAIVPIPAAGASTWAPSSTPLTLQEFTDNGLNGHLWNAYPQSTNAPGPTIFGTPSAVSDPSDGDLHVYVHGASDDLYEFVNNQSGASYWKVTDLTAADGGTSPVGGSPDAFYDPHDGLIHVYVRSVTGDLIEYVDDGADGHSWNAYDLSFGASDGGTISGTPSAFYDPADGLIHVYVEASDGYLVEYDDGDWGGHLWNAWGLSAGATGGGQVASDPAAFYDPADGLIHVYVAAAATGDLTEYDDGGWGGRLWNAWDLSSGASSGGPIAGTPSVLLDTGDDVIHIYVRASSGDLTEYDDGNFGGHLWNAWDLTVGSQGPQIGGDPTGVMWGSGIHVFAGGPNQPTLVQNIVALATSQDQYYAHVVETPLGSNCNPYTAYFGRGSTAGCAPGTSSEEWCSDFADWVWTLNGIDTGSINGWAFTWIDWGADAGTLKLGATDDPQPGDAVVWGSMSAAYAIHVGIVIGVSQGDIDVVSGNSGPPIDPEGDVAAVWESGYFNPATSTIYGYPIIGYVSPMNWALSPLAKQTPASAKQMQEPTPEQIATQDDNH